MRPPEPYGTFEAGGFFALNNDLDVVGAAPGISSANIFTWRFCYTSGGLEYCDRSMEMDGFQAASDSGVQVLAIPVSLRQYSAAEALWIAVLQKHIVVVAPLPLVAGREPTEADSTYPAQLDGVVGVAGVKPDTSFADSSGCGAYSSKYGSMVDVVAPFWGITTGNGNDLWTYCGNAYGVTLVAGVLALMRQRFPSYKATELVDKLFQSAIDRGPGGWDDHYGNGLVNALGALYVPPPPPPPPLTVTISGYSVVLPGANCLWTGGASGGTAPYTLSWFVDNNPVGDGSGYLRYTNSGASFQILLSAVDAVGNTGSTTFNVTVSGSAQECLDQ